MVEAKDDDIYISPMLLLSQYGVYEKTTIPGLGEFKLDVVADEKTAERVVAYCTYEDRCRCIRYCYCGSCLIGIR